MDLPSAFWWRIVTPSTVDGKTVLIVEDEMLIALDLIGLVEGMGCIVAGPATNVEAASHLINQQDIDIAILDVNLAGVHVWPVTDLLLARSVPFVLLSGFGATLTVPPSCRLVPRLDKPVSFDELRKVMHKLVAA
jgi:DNA-binding NtrC family response regulator